MLYLSNQMYRALEKTCRSITTAFARGNFVSDCHASLGMYERGFHRYMLHDHQTKHTTDNKWPESHRLRTAYAQRLGLQGLANRTKVHRHAQWQFPGSRAMLTWRQVLGKSSLTLKLPTGHTSKEENNLRRSGYHIRAAPFRFPKLQMGSWYVQEGSQLLTLADTLFLAM